MTNELRFAYDKLEYSFFRFFFFFNRKQPLLPNPFPLKIVSNSSRNGEDDKAESITQNIS